MFGSAEPAGSPYSMCHMSDMDQIEEIPKDNALALIAKLEGDRA